MQMGRWGIFVDVVRMRYSELLAVPVVKGMKSEEDLWTLVTSCNINRLHPEFNEYWVWPMKWSGKLSRVSQRYALVFHVNRVFRPCLHVRSALFFSFFQGEICRQRAQSDPRSFHSWNRAWNSGRHIPPQNVVSDVPNWGYVDHGMCAMGVVMMLGGSYFPLFGAEICGDVNLPLVWGENWQSWGKCKMEGSWNPETLWKMLVNFRFFNTWTFNPKRVFFQISRFGPGFISSLKMTWEKSTTCISRIPRIPRIPKTWPTWTHRFWKAQDFMGDDDTLSGHHDYGSRDLKLSGWRVKNWNPAKNGTNNSTT